MPRSLHVPKLVWLVSTLSLAGLAAAAGCAVEAEPLRARHVLAMADRENGSDVDALPLPKWISPPSGHGKAHGWGGGPLPKCLEEELDDEDMEDLDDDLPFSGKSDGGYERKPGREDKL